MCSFFYRKFEFFCWHTDWNVWPIIISDNRPIVYRYMFLEVLMNNYKSLKNQLKFCIKTMNDSSSLFVVDSNKNFTRKRKHLFGSTLFNVLLLESGSAKKNKRRYSIRSIRLWITSREQVSASALSKVS